MRKSIVMLVMGLMALLAPLFAQPAAALSCVHPREQIPRYDLLVQAKVVKVDPVITKLDYGGSRPQAVTLLVNRYFKGNGPAEVTITYDGLGWVLIKPVGSEIIIGMHRDEQTGKYIAGPCTIQLDPKSTSAGELELKALITQLYGEGKAPDAAQPTQPTEPAQPAQPRGTWILYGSMGALALIVVGFVLMRRTKK